MSLKRYLLNISYIGTPFRGSQRQIKGAGTPRPDDPTTVQGLLEMGLKYIDSTRDTLVCMASRTDAGVHALNTTCHFDFPVRNDDSIVEPNSITCGLNRFLIKNDVPIRILNSGIVPDEFHCRYNSISRTYMYRLIVGLHEDPKSTRFMHFFPIEQLERAHFCCASEFSIDTMREAASMFEGFHDFRTFMGKTSKAAMSQKGDKLTRREIFSIKIIERQKHEIGMAPSFSWPSAALNNVGPDSHVIVDIYFKGKGFLYKQVRRTAATLLSAAIGKISLKDIQFMLEVPSKHSWVPVIKTLPGCGLYLCEIEY